MYAAHFGLRDAVRDHPGHQLLLRQPAFAGSLNTLLVAARSGEGFIKITGEVGTGKTLLCRKFMATLGDRISSPPTSRIPTWSRAR
jgi:MSHA biogenesis protein MshM